MTSTKRAEAKAATRTKVIDAARKLFQHNGYAEVTIRQIAHDTGMSTGAIFASFPGKAEVFEAAMGHKAPDMIEFLTEFVEAYKESATDPAACIVLMPWADKAWRLLNHLKGHHS